MRPPISSCSRPPATRGGLRAVGAPEFEADFSAGLRRYPGLRELLVREGAGLTLWRVPARRAARLEPGEIIRGTAQ